MSIINIHEMANLFKSIVSKVDSSGMFITKDEYDESRKNIS